MVAMLAAAVMIFAASAMVNAQSVNPTEGDKTSAPRPTPVGDRFTDSFKDFTASRQSARAREAIMGEPTLVPPVDAERSIKTMAVPLPRHSRKVVDRVLPAPGPDAAESGTPLVDASQTSTSNVVRVVLLLSLLAFLPALIISMTSFLRIVVVLSMIRHAFGMPETPPNQVLVSLALFLTAFTMAPTLDAVNSGALQPFLSGKTQVSDAMTAASGPLRTFMLKQVRDTDIKAVYDMSRKPLPARAQDVDMVRLVPAFMLNELRVSFRIGFVVLLPFLLIDLVVSSMLLAMGMMMVPPSTISLPLKVLMFVLIDGWSLVMQGVVGSFH